MMPDQTRPFQIETDTSKYATGAVLTQLDANGDRHPISFISKTFSPSERNYEIYDWELWQLFELLKNGVTISKDQHTLQLYCQTTRTSLTIGKQNGSIDDRHDGHFTYLNLMLNWCTHPETR